jgi:pyruvate/2-oxoacid:ferredoxin oxidoreductase alpha subunit
MLRVRVFRPFPVATLRALVRGARRLCVIDRNVSFGHGGVFAQEIRSALYGAGSNGANTAPPQILGYVAGLGGREVTVDDLEAMGREAWQREPRGELVVWKGVKGAPDLTS